MSKTPEEKYGMALAEVFNGFLRPIVQANRELSPVDALVMLNLASAAHIACGDNSPGHFQNMQIVSGAAGVCVAQAMRKLDEAKAAEEAMKASPAPAKAFTRAQRLHIPDGESVPDDVAPGTVLVDRDDNPIGVIRANGTVGPAPEWG